MKSLVESINESLFGKKHHRELAFDIGSGGWWIGSVKKSNHEKESFVALKHDFDQFITDYKLGDRKVLDNPRSEVKRYYDVSDMSKSEIESLFDAASKMVEKWAARYGYEARRVTNQGRAEKETSVEFLTKDGKYIYPGVFLWKD